MTPKNAEDFDEFQQSELEDLYSWIDSIPLSRPKRNINRDFSDGVLVAEVVKHSLPKLVELHNYAPANSTTHKIQNWSLLNRKVFSKLHFQLSDDVIKSVALCKVGVIEKVLLMLRVKTSKAQFELNHRVKAEQTITPPRAISDKPEADQNISSGQILLEEKEQENLAKEETIQILQAKIKRLEHLVHLKDVRIDDLQNRIEQLRPTGHQRR
ncbi:hypothetical protein LOTGIDRAFT_178147 [Lottia gigantea]|uniref:Calponin-homology (CH) domain-containing protein n=1 Tax=Lottia gigantea TaxID=225164 RepID=V4A3I2_LOTGI|nr:hypothetical protein LOTGIDRAFT_178147 [Lottia gigantea]ESO98403.1 hypothetical protein LOTGIDRAFT_178147 [Lottia gigantea]